MLHRVKVVPCRKRTYGILTGCETSMIYGYRLDCSCGARGRVRRTYSEARTDLSAHREQVPQG